ncbi:MAG: aldehyde oxidase, partial [Desulfococcus sp. 4484_242]
EGSFTGTGQKLTASVGIRDCLNAVKPFYERVMEKWRHDPAPTFKKRGVGLGAMWYGIGNTGLQNPSTAQIEMDPEGSVTLYTGCADIGQGSTTVLSQIAGEMLGLSPGAIRAVVADTKYTTDAGATSASRQTYISGNAVKDAAGKLVEILLTEASNLLKRPKESLILDSGLIRDKNDPEKTVPVTDIVRRAHEKGLSLKCQGSFDPVTEPLDPETGQGVPYATYAFACHLAQVTVDVLTGEVEVNRIVAAHDVGKAINPAGVIGQIYGGVAMGIGFGLMERYVPGRTVSLNDYDIPTCKDMPDIVPIVVESAEPTGPYGAKGVGEPALIPTAPAVLNAISDALGERIYTLPANPERVLEAAVAAGVFPGSHGVKQPA